MSEEASMTRSGIWLRSFMREARELPLALMLIGLGIETIGLGESNWTIRSFGLGLLLFGWGMSIGRWAYGR